MIINLSVRQHKGSKPDSKYENLISFQSCAALYGHGYGYGILQRWPHVIMTGGAHAHVTSDMSSVWNMATVATEIC